MNRSVLEIKDCIAPAMRRFIHNQIGVSAVEFALIAPIMLILYFGSVELSLFIRVDRKVTAATSTLGDLASRATAINNSEMDDIFRATRLIFQPYDINTVRMRISSLDKNASGQVKVEWSDGCNTQAHPVNKQIDLERDIVPDRGSIIYAEIEYDYKSSIGYFFPNAQTMSDSFFLRPRRSDRVSRNRGRGYSCNL